LNEGDKIILYTDGITEAENEVHDLYGEQRLEDLLNRNATLAPENLSDMIITDVESFAGSAEQFDDITLLILEYK
jgi:serine phosphatase RsbU (regulator of sigma subunit)